MSKWKIYTPDGVQDILFDECYTKKDIEMDIRDLFRAYGFNEIESPTIEFFDVFSSEIEHFAQESMVKFFDQKGRILVLRPDITVPVARITATKNANVSLPIKYSYIGNVFRFNEVGGGRQNEFTQAGVEIVGDSSAERDAEIIAMAIKTLQTSGLTDFKIDIGQVEFFKGLAEDAGFTSEDMEKVARLIDRKDFVAVSEVMNKYEMDNALKDLFLKLPGMFGSIEVINEVKEKTLNARCLNALANIEEVISILGDYELLDYISVDLGMLKGLNYDTGIIFRGFTNGIGFPILSGGRYDALTESFGRSCPATGFSLGINMLMTALEKQSLLKKKPACDTLVCYTKETRKLAFKLADSFRQSGLKIDSLLCEDGEQQGIEYANARAINGLIFIDGNDNIRVLDLLNNTVNTTSINELLK